MAYGIAFEERVLKLYDQGRRTRQIAVQLCVSKSWCRRVRQYRDQPKPKNGGGHFKLDQAGCAALAGFVDERPDATLAELQRRIRDDLQIHISIGALWNTLRRMKLSLKKSP